MAPYARYVPPKAAAPVAAAETIASSAPAPAPVKTKQIKVPKGPSRSDDNGRKKRKRTEVDTAADEDGPAIPSKHNAVFSKFQKAARRSEAAKAAAPDDDVEPEIKPELHGMLFIPVGCALRGADQLTQISRHYRSPSVPQLPNSYLPFPRSHNGSPSRPLSLSPPPVPSATSPCPRRPCFISNQGATRMHLLSKPPCSPYFSHIPT